LKCVSRLCATLYKQIKVNKKCTKILHIKYKIVESIVKQLSSQPRKLAGGFARWCPLPTSKVTRFFHVSVLGKIIMQCHLIKITYNREFLFTDIHWR